ncbi:DNA mismatch repair protein C-terminal [Penicillium riverlandense]|uniref:DNA mismatch repair protein C-terminal n=1 Tax=Penicillium riverlandense TaxID=1903569 RepID=UPI002546D292|nr:DNA mismatch repair protein C-terminal [Penicillium riverlandense]KAJ5818829.1 DNA mismatch repair protein C-terminal [Penicillium riverlandense]
MPITALPPTTIRAIGSTSAITDPYSVVKELVDNALDAASSSLVVEISQNTLDVIQVKDNGYGIPSEDHKFVCKHAFTSKIRTTDDLRTIGGTSLGFRGEALASVANMSGGITITTRIESEAAGSCLKYGRDGELMEAQRTSHPVGTTVRITEFLKHIPVRRQTVLKSAAKNITRIKKLLQAYAMARPSKRLSLKVLKAKNENNNWVYAPHSTESFADTAMKIVGTEASSCCEIRKFSSEPSEQGQGRCYQLVSFLPKADTDFSRVNNTGQFLNVDGRPLSTSRGIGQDIVKLYKTYLRSASSKVATAVSISDPFLCLQIQCSQASYDVNIEPSKDDILFEDRDLVLSLVESLLHEQYGDLGNSNEKKPTKAKKTASNATSNGPGFELLMARKRPATVINKPQGSAEAAVDTAVTTSLMQPLNSTETTSPVNSPHSPFQSPLRSSNAANRNSEFINPWSITKMNVPPYTSERQRILARGAIHPRSGLDGNPHGFRQTNEHSHVYQTPSNSRELLSPPQSRVTSVSPLSHRQRHHGPQQSAVTETSVSNGSRNATRVRNRERYGNGALDTWFQNTTQMSLQQSPSSGSLEQETEPTPLSQLANGRFAFPTETSIQDSSFDDRRPSSLHETPNETSHHSATGDNTLPPISNDHLPESMNSGRGFPVLEKWAASLHQGMNNESYPGLEQALDFERRKKEAMQNRRTQSNERVRTSSSQPGPSSSKSPHRNRYLAARAALTSDINSVALPVFSFNQPNPTPSLSLHDPRAYLMRHSSGHRESDPQKEGPKSRRLHTSKLPFERITEGCDLHNLCLPLPSDLSVIFESFSLTKCHDIYTQRGENSEAFLPSTESPVSLWSQRLAILINRQYRTRDDSQSPEWRADLSSVVEKHLKSYDAV